MAAGILGSPGTEAGPCEESCQHIDCAQTREMATSRCNWCGKPIGYDTRFYIQPNGYDHASCFERAFERGDA